MERCGRALSMLWALRINGIIWCHVQQACLHKAVDILRKVYIMCLPLLLLSLIRETPKDNENRQRASSAIVAAFQSQFSHSIMTTYAYIARFNMPTASFATLMFFDLSCSHMIG